MTEAEHIAHAAQMESAAMAAREERLIAGLREARSYLRPKQGDKWAHPDVYAVQAIDDALRAVGAST